MDVTSASFQKVKLLGRGDVGKVYLVREKKTDKLFAMKGVFLCVLGRYSELTLFFHFFRSIIKERDD